MNCPSCGQYLAEGYCEPCAQAAFEAFEDRFADDEAQPEDIAELYTRLQKAQPDFPIDVLHFVLKGPVALGTCLTTDPINGVARMGIVTACVRGHTGYRIKATAWHQSRQVRHG